MGRTTSDTIQNKTINVNSNMLTATSQAVGDILVNNGTQFIRLARGSNGQVLTSSSNNIAWSTPGGGPGGGVIQDYYYLVYYSTGNARYEALNGITGAVDYTNATDAANVLNAAITAVSAAGGGTIMLKAGTYLTRSIIILKSLVRLVGEGDTNTIIKQDTTRNLAAVFQSENFATLTGTGNNTGPYAINLEHFCIDGNKANNLTTNTDGIQAYCMGWTLEHLRIRYCRGRGIYSEWSTNGMTNVTGIQMENRYFHLRIHDTEGIGWQNRGPHDWEGSNIIILDSTSHGYLQESGANYSGSGYVENMHIYACDGLYGAWITGGTLRFHNLTTETCANAASGVNGIGLYVSGSGTATGTGLWSYHQDKGAVFDSDGTIYLNNAIIEDNYVAGVEILRNNSVVDGLFMNNGTKGIILGNGSTPIANVKVSGLILGHTTANIDWGHQSNKAITGSVILYNDTAHPTPVLNEATIDQAANSFTYESFADGTGARTVLGKAMNAAGTAKSPFNRKFGAFYCGHNTIVTEGLYAGVNQAITATLTADQWLSYYANYNTTATQNTRAGLNSAASGIVTIFTRTSNPSKKTHLKIPNVTDTRFYGGFSSATAIPVTDTPLGTGDSGIIVGWNSTDTTIKIYRNDGSGAAPAAIDTAISKPTNWWQYEITSDDSGASFTVNVFAAGTNYKTVMTTRVPASATRLATYDIIENSAAAAAKDIQIDVSVLESKFLN